MNVLIVDDEKMPLEYMKRTIESVLTDAKVTCFMKPSEALDYTRFLHDSLSGDENIPPDKYKESCVDLAFLDIEMGGMNGLQLAKNLKDINGRINIIFTTGHSQYAAEAYSIHASGYLLKPISAESVREAMDYLYYPIPSLQDNRIYIQTFGNFEVYIRGKPISFSRTKTKELLAYLVMRNGASCSNNEIVAVLWENRHDSPALQSQFRHLVMDLRKTLKMFDTGDVLIKKRGSLAIIPEKISCDLYDFYNADTAAVNKYMGEFMAQYSWAEFNNAYLAKMH